MPVHQQEIEAAVLMAEAVTVEEAGKVKKALRIYKKINKLYPKASHSPEALFRRGEIQASRSNWRKAFEAYQKIVSYYPDYEQFDLILAKQFDMATALMEGRDMRYFGMIPFKNYERASFYFELYVRNAPYSERAPEALMNVARMRKEKKKTALAVDALDRIINNYPDSTLADDAYLKLAETFGSMVDGPEYDQGATREAINYYKDFLILYPDSDDVAEGEYGLEEMQETYARSKFILGEFYFNRRNNYRAAKVFFNEAITVSPDSESAQKAKDYLTIIEERGEDYRPASRGLAFWRKKEVEKKAPSEAEVAAEESAGVEKKKPRRFGLGTIFRFGQKKPEYEIPKEDEEDSEKDKKSDEGGQ